MKPEADIAVTPPVLHIVAPGSDERLYNEDLAPLSPERRTWGTYDLFAMWMSDVHSVGGYTFAASLFFLGLNGWQVLISMTAGILIVYVLMNLIGKPSQKYGIPYPVMARVSFGVMGANLAALIRGILGIVWYGVQTYLASKAVQVLFVTFIPESAAYTQDSMFGLSTLGWVSFLFMWIMQLMIFQRGMETIRHFIDFCGPAVYVMMFALAIWILSKSGFGSLSLQLGDKHLNGAEVIWQSANASMLVVAYFSALLLNFGDFARFGKSEAAMRKGNLWGLPVNFIVFSIVTVIVTAGTVAAFGEAIMDPVAIVERIDNKFVVLLGSLTFIVATMGINIVANFVSPAYDIANLAPRHIDFKKGGLITSILSVVVCPWLFVSSPAAITVFVSIFGSVLGPMYGIMVADYYLVKRQQVQVTDLYTMDPRGALHYQSGWNMRALAALGMSGLVSIGLALTGKLGLMFDVGDWGWAIGATLGAVFYVRLMRAVLPAAPAIEQAAHPVIATNSGST